MADLTLKRRRPGYPPESGRLCRRSADWCKNAALSGSFAKWSDSRAFQEL